MTALSYTAEDLIQLQAQQIIELHKLHKLTIKECQRAAELQYIALEKACTELALLKEKGPATITADTEPSLGELLGGRLVVSGVIYWSRCMEGSIVAYKVCVYC